MGPDAVQGNRDSWSGSSDSSEPVGDTSQSKERKDLKIHIVSKRKTASSLRKSKSFHNAGSESFHEAKEYTGCMDENDEKASEGQLHTSHTHTLLDGAQQATRRHVKAFHQEDVPAEIYFRKMLW